MPDRSYAAACGVGVVVAAVFAPALRGVPVVLDAAAANAPVAGAIAGNVALHALNAGLVVVTCERLVGRIAPSVVAALLFALHPLRVESVEWIAPRPELLGMTAALAAVLLYAGWTRHGGRWRYGMSVVTFAIAVAVAPRVSPLPILLLLLDAWPLGRLDVAAPERDPRLVRRLVEKLPFVMLAVIAVAFAVPAVARPVVSLGVAVADAFASVARYVGITIVPVGLTAIRPASPPPWWAPGAVIAVVATTASVLAARRRVPALAIGWLWFLVALLPVLGPPIRDRVTYLPSLGLAIALAWAAAAALRSRRDLARVVATVALVACVVATWRQLAAWRDEETVLRRALAVTADNLVAERRLGVLLAARGAWHEAGLHAAEALRLAPDDPEARNALGEVRLHEGHVDAAAEELTAALAARPDFLRARANLGRAEQLRGRLDEAVAAYRYVVERAPDDASAHTGLARALRQRGELDEARTHFERALILGARPAEVLPALAQTLAEAGDLDGAAERYRALLVATPDDAAAHDRLGTIAARRGDVDAAEAEYRAALRSSPDFAEARLHLGTVLAARGALDEAMAAYDAALALAPRLPHAQYDRALVLAAKGDPVGARAALRAELAFQPNWPPALVRLAALLAEGGPDEKLEAARLLDRAGASLGADDPEVQAVRRLVDGSLRGVASGSAGEDSP